MKFVRCSILLEGEEEDSKSGDFGQKLTCYLLEMQNALSFPNL